MPTTRLRTLLLAIPLAFALAACGDEDEAPFTPPTTGPIAEGAWFVHSVDGEDLPAKVAERFVGVTLEETFLDSARLEVDYVTGRYQQRWWMRVNHTGIEDRKEFVFDEGNFAETGGFFTFTSTSRTRAFTVTVPTTAEIVSNETFVFFAGATLNAATYRQSRP